jgi:phage FluMu gp28-like protein
MNSMASRSAQTEKMAEAGRALVKLYDYQKAWISDESRFKISVKGRQIGWTFGTTLRHVRRRLKLRGTTVWISASDRQSREAIEYAKLHANAVQEAFDHDEIEFPGIDDKAQQLTFKHNGARIIAMPANPDTVRGFSGDVVLDEFAFHRDPRKIWRGAMAIVSRGHSLEVISTPNGQSGKYYDISRAAGVPMLGAAEAFTWQKGIWSVHWCDVHHAVEQGCPVNIGELREAAGDEDTWLQEYCCVFLADAENYIPMELVVACESEQATLDLPDGFVKRGRLFLGIDIGRRKDRSVAWLDEEVGDVAVTRAVITLERTPFRAQFDIFDPLVRMADRACIDSTGIGAQMGEDFVAKYGAKVEAVEFNIANKERMATDVKRQFEERKCRIPGSPAIRRAMNAVKRFTSPTGHFRFDADRTEAGHADEFWGKALATAAAAGPSVGVDFAASSNRAAHAMAAGY